MMTRALVPDLQHLQNSLNVENRKASSLLFIVLDVGLSEPKTRQSETTRKRGGHLALAPIKVQSSNYVMRKMMIGFGLELL